MADAILVVNAGSSSLKVALFSVTGGDQPLAVAVAERLGTPDARFGLKGMEALTLLPDASDDSAYPHSVALDHLLALLDEHFSDEIVVAGHRVVHGGARFLSPVRIDDMVVTELEALVPLARTHQPYALSAMRSLATRGLQQIACFDTAFHATIPERATTYALPKRIRDRGVRRYGFHGLSYAWIARSLRRLGLQEARVIAAHLGNGASLCGLVSGKSQATTMGFTPLDGLVMGERPGLTDPGAILFMAEEMGLPVSDIRQILFSESGLKGLSGGINDMRQLLASETAEAKLAVDVYCHRIIREAGAIAAEIGGADAIIFTGGVGENAEAIRKRVLDGLSFLGPLSVHTIAANEEAMIAEEARAFLASLDCGQ
ncbi:MAG: acetate/propionate family kinase [Pseudomonadota bacterium]